MQHQRKRLALAVAIMLWPVSAFPQSTTREREALPPRAANRVVQRDLLSVLEPISRINSGMFVQLRGVGLTTRPFGTDLDGLCRRDAVTLWYAPTDHAARAEDAPLRPYSIDAAPLFHILALPLRSGVADRAAHVWQEKCAALGADSAWFAAKDAQTAARGAAALTAALKAVKSGTLKSLPCPDIISPKSGCEAAILTAGDISKIDSIKPCPTSALLTCYAIDLVSSTKLPIEARFGEDDLQPSEVISIAIEEYIIVT